jgi:DNA-binding NarL/FixJ family response regulator
VLTGVTALDQVVAVVRNGARAWLPKTVDIHHLVEVIRGVHRGHGWIPPELLGHVLRELTSAQPPAGMDALSGLTVRERDVLQCAVDGLTRAQAARRLCLSPNTVRTHTQNMLSKLGMHSTLEAVSLALRSGMRPTGFGIGQPAPPSERSSHAFGAVDS